MNIINDIRSQLAIHCDDHLDVEREDDICIIEMWDCEYSVRPLKEDVKSILDDIREFGIEISSVCIIKYEAYYEISIKGIMTPWLAYQDEILTKHERYIRRKLGLPLGPRPNKKTYHRIVKGGFDTRTGKQRYILIDNNGHRVKCSVNKAKLEQLEKTLVKEAMQNEFPFLFRGL